jgi:hypothetical protein
MFKVLRQTPISNYKHGPDITGPVTEEENHWRNSIIYTIPVNDLDRLDIALIDYCRTVSPPTEMEFSDATVVKVLDNGNPSNRVDVVFMVIRVHYSTWIGRWLYCIGKDKVFQRYSTFCR